MKVRALGAKLVLAASLALATPCLWAQDGLEGALRRANLAAPFGPTLAVADFDNDSKPDGAILSDSGWHPGQNSFRIEVHLSGRTNSWLTFESAETANGLAAWDIDKDGDIDIIVEQPFTEELLYVWLNDGDGVFHKCPLENLPSPVPARERLKPPLQRLDAPAVSLPSQRGPEIAPLTARRLAGRPSLTSKFQALPTVSSSESRPFAQNAPRAPPAL